MPKKKTDEEVQLALSAKDAHNLIEMVNSNGWKVIKEMYFDTTLKQIREYLDNVDNTDMFMIQAKRELRKWVQNLLDDIKLTIEIGLQNEKELAERVKEKEMKK
jgi:DNA-binding transcriptional MerR regulator